MASDRRGGGGSDVARVRHRRASGDDPNDADQPNNGHTDPLQRAQLRPRESVFISRGGDELYAAAGDAPEDAQTIDRGFAQQRQQRQRHRAVGSVEVRDHLALQARRLHPHLLLRRCSQRKRERAMQKRERDVAGVKARALERSDAIDEETLACCRARREGRGKVVW